MTEPKELFNCRYCNAEVPELHLKDEEGRGLCGVCMNTVPREWGDDVIGEWRLRGNGTLVLLKATNHNTNFILTAIEGLCEEVAALKADDGRVERRRPSSGLPLDPILYSSMHLLIREFVRIQEIKDADRADCAMSDAHASAVELLEKVEGKS